ncbi:MAG TPA: hypothetical protein VIA18_17345 [Polyangia bacterium]|nr:hypothetical protein [Polyangia bacterium]
MLATGISCHGRVDGGAVAPRAQAALVHELHGRVDVLRGGTVDWTALGDGTTLYEEDRMRTFRGAWARLDFPGGSSLRVQEETLIALGGGVLVEHGIVEGELAAGLKLRTPTLEAETGAARDIQFR